MSKSVNVKVDIRYINWKDEDGDELDFILVEKLGLPRICPLMLELKYGDFDETDLYRRCTDILNENYKDTGMTVQDFSIINVEKLKEQLEV